MTSRISIRTVPFYVLLAACEWGGGPGPLPNAQTIDAAPIDSSKQGDATRTIDGNAADGHEIDAKTFLDAPAPFDAHPDTSIDAPVGRDHILLTEVALAGSATGEFIEIYSPLPEPLDLSTYYLSNYGDYFELPVGTPVLPEDHFIVQFPAGASISPGQVITVSVGSAPSFVSTYGLAPTYSITDGTINTIDGSGNGTPHLTSSGSFVVLFQWDGAAGIVRDVDMMLVGQPNSSNQLIPKSGVMQKGDAYATDADTIAAQSGTPQPGTSTKRISAEVGHETQTGAGNGITGHDETSENTSVTWDSTFSPPTPGTVPAGL